MAELRLDEASRKALEERLRSPEGQEILDCLAGLIARSAAERMPADLLRSLDAKEGKAAFRAAWPGMVDAFLFRQPRPRNSKGKPSKASRLPRVAK